MYTYIYTYFIEHAKSYAMKYLENISLANAVKDFR